MYNTRVRRATSFLLDVAVKDGNYKLMWFFYDACMRGQALSFSISENFHRFGINIRYIGNMIQLIKDYDERNIYW